MEDTAVRLHSSCKTSTGLNSSKQTLSKRKSSRGERRRVEERRRREEERRGGEERSLHTHPAEILL